MNIATGSVAVLCFFGIGISLLAEAGEDVQLVSVIAERVEGKQKSVWSVETINDETISNNPGEHIQQLLNRAPGLNLQRGNGMEYLPSLRSPVLTGAGACGNVLTMEEGIRLRGAGVCNVNELFDTHYEQATQVEVMRAPLSAFHGANGLLGAIDIRLGVIEQPIFSLDASSEGFKQLRVAQPYNKSEQKGVFYFTGTKDNAWRDQSGVEQQKLSWRHHTKKSQWQFDPGFTLVNLNQETAGFIEGKDAYKNKKLAETNQSPEAYRDNKALRFWLHARYQKSKDTQVLVSPYARYTEMDFLQHFLPGDPLEKNRQTGLGLQTSIYQQLSSMWQFNYGIDWEYTQASLKQSQDALTEGSAFLIETIPVGEHYNYDVDIFSVATFFQATADLSDYSQLSAGLRLENNVYDYTNFLPVGRTRDDGTTCGFGGCRYSRPPDGQSDFTHLAPNLAWRKQHNNLSIFVSVGQSFRPPQTSELYRLQREQQKADLDNVKVTHYNSGFLYTAETLFLRLEAYYQRIRNLIIRDVNFFNIDNAQANSTGIELTWRQSFGQWQTQLVLNWARHRYGDNQFLGEDENEIPIDVSGNDADTAPSFFGNYSIQWQPTSDVVTQLQLDFTDEYYLEPLNEYKYEGHSVWHWNTRWQLDSKTHIRFKINNLFDKRYASRADFTSFTGYRYFPGEPRSVFFGIDYKFL